MATPKSYKAGKDFLMEYIFNDLDSFATEDDLVTQIIRAKRVILYNGICELRLLHDPEPGFIVDLEVVN